MGDIVKFETKDKEAEFIESLNDWQTETFFDIIQKSISEFETLQSEYIKKIAECEMLRMQLEVLKGER